MSSLLRAFGLKQNAPKRERRSPSPATSDTGSSPPVQLPTRTAAYTIDNAADDHEAVYQVNGVNDPGVTRAMATITASWTTQIKALKDENARLKDDAATLKDASRLIHQTIELQKTLISSKDIQLRDQKAKHDEAMHVLMSTHDIEVQRLIGQSHDMEAQLAGSNRQVALLQRYKDLVVEMKEADLEADEYPHKRRKLDEGSAVGDCK